MSNEAPEVPRAHLPQTVSEEFRLYLRWWNTGTKVEIMADDAGRIDQVRQAEPRFVSTLKYLGIGKFPMGVVSGFEEPDGETVERWLISSEPWPFEDESWIKASYLGECTLCNVANDEEGDPDCSECEGEGWVDYWFEDFDENGERA